MEINKQDKVHHETEVCEYRRVKCHDCGKMQEVIGRLERKMVEQNKKVEEAREENKKQLQEVRIGVKYIGDKVEAINEEMKTVGEVKKEDREVKIEMGEVKKEVKDVKENLSKVNKDVDEVKVMMSQVLEKLNMLEHLNKLPSPTEGMLNIPREDILIAGGYHDKTGTEIFSWEKNGWFEVSSMNEDYAGASSFIYKDQIFVAGGRSTKAIESFNLSVLPLKWRKFSRELPFKCDDFQTVVCQQTVIHIGGFNWTKNQKSNMISELQLTSPSSCFMKELCQMPEPRDCHSAEVFEDKVLILGGQNNSAAALDSVLEFDPKRN